MTLITPTISLSPAIRAAKRAGKITPGALRLAVLFALMLVSGAVFAQATPVPQTPITARNAKNLQFGLDIVQPDVVNDLAFSPFDATLATVSQDTAVRLWSTEDGAMISEAYEHFSFVKALAFTPQMLITAGWDRQLIEWGQELGQITAQTVFSGYSAVIETLAVSPDGAKIAFGVGDGRVRLVDAATGAVEFELPVGALRVTAVAYSPDGTRIAAAGGFPATGAVVWSAATGIQEASILHTGTVTALAYSPDGTILAAAGDDGTVTLWRGSEKIGTLAVEDWVTDIAFTPDGSALVAARQDGVMTLWDVTNPAVPVLAAGIVAADEAINAIAFNADGTQLATASEDGSVRLWQVK